MNRHSDGPGIRFPPPLVYAAFLVLGIVLNAWHPVRLLPSAPARVLGAAILACGVALGPIWGVWTLRKAGTTVRPDKPTTALVTGGPFRFSRNPLYLSMAIAYVGIALMANSSWALVLLFPVTLIMSRFVIRREEEYLAHTFGPEYERYKVSVRRWM
jgi:protein-S-isoprenylcysteine O-methyltransferase Ste14